MKPYENNLKELQIIIGDATFCARISGDLGQKYDTRASGIHLHSGIEIQCIKEGVVTIETDNDKYLAKAGDIVVIPSGIYHHNEEEIEPYLRFTCEVSILPNNNFTEFSEYLMYNRVLSRIKEIKVFRNEEVFKSLERLSHLENLNSSEKINKIKSVVSIFLIDLFADLKGRILSLENGAKSEKIKKNTSVSERQMFIISNSLSENYNSENLAEIIEKSLNMSKRNTARIVFAHFGKTISELALEHRMKMALVWIKNSNIPLGEIAEKVGYKTYVAFFTAFKKYYGFSPNEYRK